MKHKSESNRRRHLEVYATPNLPPHNWDWISERIMAGRNPLTCCDVETLVCLGITHILDLREPKEWQEPHFGSEAIEEIERCGLHRLHLMVRDKQAPSVAVLDKACEFMESSLADPTTRVYVHCRAGMERTAAILIAYYARQHGVTYDVAFKELRQARSILKPLSCQEAAVRRWISQSPLT